MKRRAEPLEVEIDGDVIRIRQRDPLENGDAVIVISQDQVPQLVGWLREAEATLEQRESSGGPVAD
jgi:hypothetical protein